MSRNLSIVLVILLGSAIGLGIYTFVYARGGSYLSSNPAACANCHIMRDHFDAWIKSSHHTVATCNDCHTPPGAVAKYMTKASNGFWHSFAFTTGDFPDPLRIKPGNHAVTEAACRGCHADIVDAIDGVGQEPRTAYKHAEHDAEDDDLSCVRCHKHVGHWVR